MDLSSILFGITIGFCVQFYKRKQKRLLRKQREMNDVRVFDEVRVFGFSQLPPPLNSHPCWFFDAAVTAGVDRKALAIRRPTHETASMINQTIDQSFLNLWKFNQNFGLFNVNKISKTKLIYHNDFLSACNANELFIVDRMRDSSTSNPPSNELVMKFLPLSQPSIVWFRLVRYSKRYIT